MSRLLAKRWAIALVISLAVNLFLGGLLVTRSLRQPRHGGHGMPPMRLDSLKQQIDPNAQKVLERINAKHDRLIHDKMVRAGEARQHAMSLLASRDFDETEAREALRIFRSESSEANEAVHEALLEMASALSPEQREALSEVLNERGRHGKRSRHMRLHGAPDLPPSGAPSGR